MSQQVTLIKPHKHAGVNYQPGDAIIVPASAVVWLENHGIIEKVKTTTPGAKRSRATEES